MRLTGIVNTVCAPHPDCFKWILGTIGKLRCVPCCGIYPEVRPNCPPRIFCRYGCLHIYRRDCRQYSRHLFGRFCRHTWGHYYRHFFRHLWGHFWTPLQTPISQLYSSLSPALSPKCPKFRTPLPSPLPPPLQPHFILSSIPESVAYICYLSKTELINIAYLKQGYPNNAPCLN